MLRFTLVQFDAIGADMSFMDATFSKWGEVATAVLSQSLAKRFARVMLAAVLAASFLPVAASLMPLQSVAQIRLSTT